MAGDWIKMGKDLLTHPKVVRISSALKADKLKTVGGLFAVWCLFDTHSIDGNLSGYTYETIDEEIRFPGFSAAMESVGWLKSDAEGASLPDFEEHNGQSAKRRAQETERKRNERKTSAPDADKKRTREEKRREDINNPKPLKGHAVSINTWADETKAKGEKLIPPQDPVFEYADSIALPQDFLRVAWFEFMQRYSAPGSKRYKDWRAVFRKAVRGNWFKLWWLNDGAYELTTVGLQAKRSMEAKAA